MVEEAWPIVVAVQALAPGALDWQLAVGLALVGSSRLEAQLKCYLGLPGWSADSPAWLGAALRLRSGLEPVQLVAR
jgi:hypothetical protein